MNISMWKGLVGLGALVACTAAIAFQTTVQVRLESTNDRRVSRQLDRQISKVRLIDRLSDSRCTAGTDWGYSGRTLWVDNGCRGVFEVRYRTDTGPGIGDGKRYVTLGTASSTRTRAWVGRNAKVVLSRKLSTKPCVRGSSWGYDGAYVWVSRGCRAQFLVSR